MKHGFYLSLLMGLALPVKAQQKWITAQQPLDKNWQIQSAALVQEEGKVIATAQYAPQQWYPAKVPGTVMASLVEDGVYKDIFFHNNMEKISTEPFKHPWWHRTSFELPPMKNGQVAKLLFNGINYRASIWVNGTEVAPDTVRGGFRRFELDISKLVHPGKNVLALKITAPDKGDPTLGFVDWNPAPPDRNMGIWRDVQLLLSGPVAISQPFVQTTVDTATLKRAAVTVSTILRNESSVPVTGTLEGTITGNIRFSQQVTLSPNSSRTVTFSPGAYPALQISNPRLWWTRDLGKPELYDLALQFKTGNTVTDTRNVRFGIRQVSDYINEAGHRGYLLNGKKLLIRGGGWTDPMLLNATPDYERAGIDYAVQMNLNTIRMEGFWGNNQHLYDLCDEKGIFIMVGWSAQWEWDNYMGKAADEFGGIVSPEQQFIAAQSLKDQITWLRNHPSIFVWVYGSDKLPRPALEQQYLAILREYDPSRPSLSSAHDNTSSVSGPAGVKMRGPYDYVPPDYWYIDDKNGGAFGFNTETGPGPQVPLLESLRKMIPEDSLWPISNAWMYHAARGEFHNLDYYNNAMEKRLGKAVSLDDYIRKAQYLNYEGMRAMLEAFTANRPAATGIIQWMYNASWPKLWWQLYDYYLLPTGAFYGARKAGEPLHISWNYGRRGVDVINNTAAASAPLKARIQVLNIALQSVYKADTLLHSVQPQKALQLPALPVTPPGNTWYLDLQLEDNGKAVSRNFYVLSNKQDELDTAKTNWYVTPQTAFADLTALQQLPPVKLEMQSAFTRQGDTTFAKITLRHPGTGLAFMVHLDIRGANGETIVPVFWEDNDFTMLPGETITINGYVHTKALQQQKAVISLSGWNIVPITQP
ncbi:glycoside hydrolase family 2 protein [Chitinophaga arvensicola]|uniref:Exo-1,4-beta-D-glucosaminidase n=1 Tax=Chitinophaga arvensicola TaxID=29529 RepID=A0A1I0SE29_9BACT|nr:sugar-binding domain-containing protein [Chitinophaga arvensicola]SEW57415.1 exo-1,4-beta-D-glucosaminidase [Chitinophaga arvensicola]